MRRSHEGNQVRLSEDGMDVQQPRKFSGAPVDCLGLTFENDVARRDYFIERLREKLSDPEFRKIEGFPIGKDEDILELSDPPYYTTCPNPFIEDFIRLYGKPYDQKVPVCKEPFAFDVSEGKQDPICMAHTYHTKVPYRAIMRYILHYTSPGDLVLDSFAGTGMTGLAAQLCETPDSEFKETIEQEWAKAGKDAPIWGKRYALLYDISPLATFLARNFNSDLPRDIFIRDANDILNNSEKSLGWVYETDMEGSSSNGKFLFGLWSDALFCECGREVILWYPDDSCKSPSSVETSWPCPFCDAEISKETAKKVHATFHDEFLDTTITQNKQVLVLIEARFGERVIRKKPSKFDKKR